MKTEDNKKLLSVPLYGWKALFIIAITNVLVYNGNRLITGSWHHYDFSCFLDRSIPFVKEFIIIYIPVAFAQWIYGFILLAKEDRNTCLRACIAEVSAKLLCLVAFLTIPTTMVRSDVTGNDFFSECVKLVYSVDSADNLLPSIHCLESYFLARTLGWVKHAPKWYRVICIPVSVLVMMSTLLVKQHVVLDVITGMAVVEIGLVVSKVIIGRKRTL